MNRRLLTSFPGAAGWSGNLRHNDSFFLQIIYIYGHNDLGNDASAGGELTLVVL